MLTKATRRVIVAVAVTSLLSIVGSETGRIPFEPGVPANLPGVATPLSYASRVISPTQADVPNSGRGQYYWLEVPPDPVGWAAPDVYFRDQIQWGRSLEVTRGTYDFTSVERGLELARQRGGRFSFRIMAFCPGCGGTLTPNYIPRQSTGAPAWNSEEFLSGWEQLMAALGRRYDTDPRLGYLDIGGYGAAGEWYYQPAYGEKITDANARRVMLAVMKAFPSKPKMVNWLDGWPEVATSLGTQVGIRVDCIGGFPMEYRGQTDAVNNAWRTAPMVGEWCNLPTTTAQTAVDNVRQFHLSHLSSGNHPVLYDQMSSDEQTSYREANSLLGYRYSVDQVAFGQEPTAGQDLPITVTWSNGGVAPTYDAWNPALLLQDSSRRTVWSAPIPVDLRTVLPGTRSISTTVRLPSSLRGSYRLAVSVTDPEAYLRPMALAQQGAQTDGSYELGSVRITSPRRGAWTATR